MSAATSSEPGRSAVVQPITTESPRRTGHARHGLLRALLATGVVVAGVGVTFATSASADTTTTTPSAPASSAVPDSTEPDEGTVGEPVVVTIIPPAAPEPSESVPAPVIRSEAIGRPAVVATPQAGTDSFVPLATAKAATTKALPRLPETGSTTGPLVVGGVGLVGLGVVALACGRRPRTA